MIRVLGVGLLLGMAMGASAAVAQLPISPVYRSGSEQAQPAPDNGAPAKDRAPVTGDDRENAPPAKPAAGEPQPVAMAPIPPPLRPDANDGDAAAETRSRPAAGPSEQTPGEKTQKGRRRPRGRQARRRPHPLRLPLPGKARLGRRRSARRKATQNRARRLRLKTRPRHQRGRRGPGSR